MLHDLLKKGQDISNVQRDVETDALGQQLKPHNAPESMPEELTEQPKELRKDEFQVHMEGYLEMEIDTDNYDVPMPPQQYGPLTQEDHEVAEMYDAMSMNM